MLEDFVWRQFLWFCLRNGLWYGDTGDVESFLGLDDHQQRDNYAWDEKKEPHTTNRHVHDEDEDSGVIESKTVVVVSALERTHRSFR